MNGKFIGGVVKNYQGGMTLFSYERASYDSIKYINDFIFKSTLMTETELANYEEIKRLLRINPNIIEKHLLTLRAQEKVRLKMNKREELMKLLTPMQRQIIAEIAAGTPFKEIHKRLSIANYKLSANLSQIYKNTADLITYHGQKTKFTDLCAYLFNECGFAKGQTIDNSQDKIVAKSNDLIKEKSSFKNKKIDSDKFENEHVIENLESDRRYAIANILLDVKYFLEEKAEFHYKQIGRFAVCCPEAKVQNCINYNDAVNYTEAINIIVRAANQLVSEGYKNE